MSHLIRRSIGALALASTVSFSSQTYADTTWLGGTGNWSSVNWSSGIPNASTDALIDSLPAVSSVVTVGTGVTIGSSDGEAARNLTLDAGDQLIIGNANQGITTTLAVTSFINNGLVTQGFNHNSSLNASGTITNGGEIRVDNDTIFRLNAPSVINNGTIQAVIDPGHSLAALLINSTNVPGGMSITGSGNLIGGPATSVVIQNPITLTSTGYIQTDANNFGTLEAVAISIANLRGAGPISFGSTSNAFSTLTFSNGDAAHAFSGSLSGLVNVTKTGAGTQILSGSNSYLGTTDIYAGILQADSALSALGNGDVTVHDGGTLAGVGDSGAFNYVLSGGTIAPGDSGPGTMRFFGLYLRSGSILALDLGDGAGASDLVRAYDSEFTADDVGVDFDINGSVTAGHTYTIINYAGSLGGALPGDSFDATDFHLLPGAPVDGFFNVDAANSLVTFTVTATPEPASLGIALLGAAGLLMRRRR